MSDVINSLPTPVAKVVRSLMCCGVRAITRRTCSWKKRIATATSSSVTCKQVELWWSWTGSRASVCCCWRLFLLQSSLGFCWTWWCWTVCRANQPNRLLEVAFFRFHRYSLGRLFIGIDRIFAMYCGSILCDCPLIFSFVRQPDYNTTTSIKTIEQYTIKCMAILKTTWNSFEIKLS